jgi:hypothetical protein
VRQVTDIRLRERRRPDGVLVTDRKGDTYVARLGSNLTVVDGVIESTGGGGPGGSFTPGSVIFADALGALDEDNASFFWDDTNNRLGVRRTPTLAQLELGAGGLAWFGLDGPSGGFTLINDGTGISAADTTIDVDSTTGFPSSGVVRIESELITYTGTTATSFTGCTRGRFGTTAATHNDNTPVRFVLFLSASDATDTNLIVMGPGTLHVGVQDFWEPGSGSTLTRMAIGRFSVSDTFIGFSDGTTIGMYGNGFLGTRSGHDLGFRTNNVTRLFIDTSGLVQFAGQTSSFPALKRSSTELQVRLADDSAYAPFRAGDIYVDGTLTGHRGEITITLDGGGSVLTTGAMGVFRVPRACTITKWTVLAADGAMLSGSIVLDLWKDTWANYLAGTLTVADTITAAAKPTVSAARGAESSSLTGWTPAITAGDAIAVNVDSVSTFTRVALVLEVRFG